MKKVIDTYRGFKILIDNEAVTYKVTDHGGKILNDNVPFYSVTASAPKKYYTGTLHCCSSETDTTEALTYMKQQIDQRIEWDLGYQRERIAEHRNSKHVTYIFDNVTVNVLVYGDTTKIYVNENPLRYASLPENFTLEDVLKCIHTCKIARYNVNKFSDLGTNYYRNKRTHTAKLSILPVYELLGCAVEIKGKDVVLSNVRTSSCHDKIVLEAAGETFELSIEEIQNLKVLSLETQGMSSMPGLMNKMKFIE